MSDPTKPLPFTMDIRQITENIEQLDSLATFYKNKVDELTKEVEELKQNHCCYNKKGVKMIDNQL